MDESKRFSLLVDLHRDGARQGPGGDKKTLHALELSRLGPISHLKVADLGCGTGTSTMVLACELENTEITAVDLFQNSCLY